MAYCSFCNEQIPRGTGETYVLRDGTSLLFCSSKCKSNGLHLKREGRLVKWTSKEVILSTEKKAVEKKESALAHEIEEKLKEKEAAKAAAAPEKKK
jgi:large subunit ribosomal protein L24e